MAKSRDPNTAPGEDSLHGDSVDGANASRADTASNRQASDDASAGDGPAEPDWLQLAKDSYSDSDDFMESNLRHQWERNERAFQSRHPSGSKYRSDQYRGRSNLFRPKTRTNIRQAEAALAVSMFSNENVLSVAPMDESDKEQMASADVVREIMQYRLTQPNPKVGIPWFVTCLGAGQDAQKYGVVTSKQWWEYKTRTETEISLEPVLDDFGAPVIDAEGRPEFREVETEVETVVVDRPRIDLIEPENVRIDRSADWTDPINSSPFVILLHPMYIHEIRARMSKPDAKTGQPAWYELSVPQLRTAGTAQAWDSTRAHREDNREDSQESYIAIDDYQTVWVHENFITWDDREWVYYTAGTHFLLSDPVPLEEAYPHCDDGIRPITMGCVIIETHKIYPSGKPQLTEGLQAEANEIVNLRLDNVKLALNKRYIVKRGRQVDLRSLLRNISGSVTLATDPKEDIQILETRDVTASSYKEQDRINADFDDIAGGFSRSSVQTNRAMNETVGGMDMIMGAGTMLQELDLRTFIETWAEATLGQVIKMIQTYENDETIVALAGNKAEVFQRYGVNEITDEMLKRQLTTKLNVGIGATDPKRRLEKIVVAGKAVVEMFGEKIMMQANIEEFINEIFGAVGYRDGRRFFKFGKQDPMVKMLTQELQELQKKMDRKELDAQTKVKVAETGAMAKIETTGMDNRTELEITRMREDGARDVEAMRSIAGAQQTSVKTEADAARERISNVAKFELELKKEEVNARGRNAAAAE